MLFVLSLPKNSRPSLRAHTQPHIELGKKQREAGKRSRTFWVGCSDWAAYHCERHMGVRADRIIFGSVDTDAFFPAQRQMRRDTARPVVLHHCIDPNKGNGIIAAVANSLGNAMDVRRLDCAPDKVAETMRHADMWLSLSASEGLPTVVQEAQATNLVVAGTNVGVLWPYSTGTALPVGNGNGAGAWLNEEIGGVVFDWKWRSRPDDIAACVRAAWEHRKRLYAREHALRWYGLGTFGEKWIGALGMAAGRFKLKAPPVPKPKHVPLSPVIEAKPSRMHAPPYGQGIGNYGR